GAGVNVQGGDSNVTAQAKNTIIAGNFSTNNTDVAGAFTSHGHNLIGDGSGSSGFNSTVDQVGDAANPIDPQLGPLQNNGGPTRTLAPMPGSPVIDAGDNIGAAASDQRGRARILAGKGTGIATIDIGAVEYKLPRTGI